MRKSVLFVRPDYHCSFFYKEELRKLGWKADIYVEPNYPVKLLYSSDGILRPPVVKESFPASWYLNKVLNFLYYLTIFWKYKYHVYYSRPSHPFDIWERKLKLNEIFGKGFVLSLSLAKLVGSKIIYIAAGCHDMETKAVFQTFDNGNVCNNCGSFDKCNDENNNHNFEVVKRYADLSSGDGFLDSSQFPSKHFKYKIIDLDLWNPALQVPAEYKTTDNGKLKILHSYVPEGRDFSARNIKGSPYILQAIDRLIEEGYPIEYMAITNVPSNKMRYIQVQADIVVEQLIYGNWGSTGVECMALGKPVVCYVRQSCKNFFLSTFPEYKELPVIEADILSIYEVLKKLVTDHEFRNDAAKKSRAFAESHFNVQRNVASFTQLLLEI